MDDLNLEANTDLENKDEDIFDEDGNKVDKITKKNEEKDKDEDGEDSVIIQKKKWRGKAKDLEIKLAESEKKLATAIQKDENISESEAEKKAKSYLKSIVTDVVKEEKEAEKKQEQDKKEKFDTKLDDVLEDNLEYTKKELKEVCDELECSPEQGIKVLKRQDKKSPRKPKMPSSKRASTETEKKKEEKPETDFFKVAEQAKKDLSEKLS